MKLVAGVLVAVGLGAAVVLAPWLYALAVPAIISFGVLALVLWWTTTGDPLDHEVARWTYVSYSLHLVLSLAIGASGLSVTFFGGDADTYHDYSVALARSWSEGTAMPQLPVGKEGFFIALARLYELIGPYRVGGLALTSLCSAVVVPLVADTTRRLFGRRSAHAVLPLIVLLPGFLVWTSQLLREAPIVAGIALGANLAVRLSEEVNPGRLAALGLTLALLFTLRANVAYVFAAGLLVGLALGRRHLLAGVATSAAIMGLVAAIVLAGGLGQSGYERATTADLKQVNAVRSELAATAKSGVARQADVSTAAGSLAYLPIGVPLLLFGPFPWQAHNLRQALGLLEAMTIWFLIPSLIRGMRRAGRRTGRKVFLLVAPAAGVAVVLALLIGNLGTLVRERLQVVVLLLPFIAVGWAKEGSGNEQEESVLGTPVAVVAGLSRPERSRASPIR